MGLVLTWHMYKPLSSCWTPLTWSSQVFWLSWDTLNLGTLDITCLWMVRIICRSMWIQATYNHKHAQICKIQFLVCELNVVIFFGVLCWKWPIPFYLSHFLERVFIIASFSIFYKKHFSTEGTFQTFICSVESCLNFGERTSSCCQIVILFFERLISSQKQQPLYNR